MPLPSEKTVLRISRAKHKAPSPSPREIAADKGSPGKRGVLLAKSALLPLNELLGQTTDKKGRCSISCGIHIKHGYTFSKRALAQLIKGFQKKEKLQPLNTALKGVGINYPMFPSGFESVR